LGELLPEKQAGSARKKVHSYLKYSGIAFQMAGLVIAGILLGKWLDNKLGTPKPFFTIGLVLLFFTGFMYRLYVDLTRKPDDH